MGFQNSLTPISSENLKKIKTDKRLLEWAIKFAHRKLNNKSVSVYDESCVCPFHDDRNPSGSLHWAAGRKGDTSWLYTCHGCPDKKPWNQSSAQKPTNSGDAIAVVQEVLRRQGKQTGLQEAAKLLLEQLSKMPQQCTLVQPSPQESDLERKRQAASRLASSSHDLLKCDQTLGQRLWNTRAIDTPTIERFGIGYSCDQLGREWWTLPIGGFGKNFQVLKRHAADGKSPKSSWQPKGAKEGNPLFPNSIHGNGPVYIAPGELKGAAVASLDVSVIGITSGEAVTRLPKEAIQSAKGRRVGILPDADDQGRRWAEAVATQLRNLGIETRIVDLGLSEGEDVGDWLVKQRVQKKSKKAEVADELNELFKQSSIFQPNLPSEDSLPDESRLDNQQTVESPPDDDASEAHLKEFNLEFETIGDVWADPNTWKPVKRVATHIAALDEALYGGLAQANLHFIVGKPGQCKTQLAVQMAVNAAASGSPIGLISLEMSKKQIGQLTSAQISGVARRVIGEGFQKFNDKPAKESHQEAIAKYKDLPLHVIDGIYFNRAFTREDVEWVVSCGVKKHGWKMVILDHLGELQPCILDPTGNPLEVDKANTQELRRIAVQHDVAMVVVAPVRKAANYKPNDYKNRQKCILSLDDLMGSANLTYAAHTCLGVRLNYEKDAPNASCVLVEILKSREAAKVDKPIELKWYAACGRVDTRGNSVLPSAQGTAQPNSNGSNGTGKVDAAQAVSSKLAGTNGQVNGDVHMKQTDEETEKV